MVEVVGWVEARNPTKVTRTLKGPATGTKPACAG